MAIIAWEPKELTCSDCGQKYPNCIYVILFHALKGQKKLTGHKHVFHKHPGKDCQAEV